MYAPLTTAHGSQSQEICSMQWNGQRWPRTMRLAFILAASASLWLIIAGALYFAA